MDDCMNDRCWCHKIARKKGITMSDEGIYFLGDVAKGFIQDLHGVLDRLEKIERLREKLRAYQMKEVMEKLESQLEQLMRKTK